MLLILRIGLSDDIRVSIRSPHRSEGRCTVTVEGERSALFQSAPPTEVRGDGTVGAEMREDL